MTIQTPPASTFALSGAALPAAGPLAGRLGKDVKTVDQTVARALRSARLAAKLTAANCLKGHDDKLAQRISACCRVAHGSEVQLVAQKRASGETTAQLRGLVTCKSVWSCPVCSARVSARRKDELNALLAWARHEGHSVVMLTLTARHRRDTELLPFLAAMKAAGQSLRRSRGWRGLGLLGSVAAQEVTHGSRNGWHVHSHVLLILPSGEADALAAVERLRAEWLRSLGKVGLSGNKAAFQAQSATAAGDYVGKFGAAEELALGHVKQGRAGSRSPWQLLADARDGDAQSAVLFRVYSLAFKGRRQLVWSPGLKALAGVVEVSDDDAPAGDAILSETVVRAWSGGGDAWRAAAKRYCALLDAVEVGGDLSAAEFGPPDARRWRAEYLGASVLE